MTRRDAVTAALMAALSGCSSRGPARTVTGGPVTITWYASTITNRHQEPRQALLDAFQRAYPSITVGLVSTPTNTDEMRNVLHQTISADAGDGTPDVYLGDVIWPAEFAAAGLALPLDDYYPPTFWSRFPGELLAAASYAKKTYGVPFYTDQGVLLYRKDLLAEERLPNPPRTWEDLVAAARVLLDKKHVEQGFVWQGEQYEGLTCVWTEFSSPPVRSGAPAPGAGDGETRPVVDTAFARSALRFMRSLLTSGISPYDVTRSREAQTLEAFESGRAAFQRAWNSAYFDTATLTGSRVHGKVGVAPLPTFRGEPGRGPSTIGGWSLYVNPHTRHLRQALAFIDWLTATPAQLTLAQYSVFPTNEKARTERAVTGNPVLAAAARTRPVRRPSFTPKYRQVSQVIYRQVHQALLGRITPDAALRVAQERIDGILG